MKKVKQGAFLKNIVSQALPWYVARRMPPGELLRAWPDMVGQYLAGRTSPVCLQPDGLLIVAVRGAALRQELTLSAAELISKLASFGFMVSGLKIITSRPRKPSPVNNFSDSPRPELQDRQKLLARAGRVKSPQLRQALLEMLDDKT